jgi:hypothetical protein
MKGKLPVLAILTLVAIFFFPIAQLHQRDDLRIVYWQCATIAVFGFSVLLVLRSRKK